jgi:phosphatidylinositol-3-phosphatase
MRYSIFFGCFAAAFAVTAATADDGHIKTVFVIALENQNWTQPANQFTGGQQQIFQNPAAPFINSLVNGTGVATINGRQINISRQMAFATNYHNALATPDGNNPHIHPSEPNYFWAEAGTNYNIFDDDDPFQIKPPQNFVNNQDNQLHLVTLLTNAGRTWRSYQEDTDLKTVGGTLINVPLPRNQWTVPLTSFSGNFGSGTFNQFNGTTQFNYAAKHNPQVFFTDSNGGNDPTPANPLSQNYAPLQQLFVDLANNDVADYNWITPNQFNDMHTPLAGGFKGFTGDAARIAQGDNFLSIVVPMIMASRAYQDHGAIIIWTDETEPDTATANPDDGNHTLLEFVISPLAHPNVGGLPFASPVFLTHSSDLRTMQKIFHVTRPLFLGDAVHANDLSSLFAKDVIPHDDDDDSGSH